MKIHLRFLWLYSSAIKLLFLAENKIPNYCNFNCFLLFFLHHHHRRCTHLLHHGRKYGKLIRRSPIWLFLRTAFLSLSSQPVISSLQDMGPQRFPRRWISSYAKNAKLQHFYSSRIFPTSIKKYTVNEQHIREGALHFLLTIMAIHCKATTTCAMDKEEEANQSAVAKIIIYSLKNRIQSVNSQRHIPLRETQVYMAN